MWMCLGVVGGGGVAMAQEDIPPLHGLCKIQTKFQPMCSREYSSCTLFSLLGVHGTAKRIWRRLSCSCTPIYTSQQNWLARTKGSSLHPTALYSTSNSSASVSAFWSSPWGTAVQQCLWLRSMPTTSLMSFGNWFSLREAGWSTDYLIELIDG